MSQLKIGNLAFFPVERFNPDFPLPVWFAGLWFYLKSFLYLCYIYLFGLEPAPYPPDVVFEILYFGFTMMPAFCLGLLLWNRRERFILPAIVFLIIDTPVLLYHVIRLGRLGFLDSIVTKGFEFGSLGLNVMVLAWLINYFIAKRVEALSRHSNKA